MSKTQTIVLTHKWQDSNLGLAPFKLIGMIELPDRGLQAANPDAYNNLMQEAQQIASSYRVRLGSCNYCGTGLKYHFVIKSADGQTFVVGSDCVLDTNDSKLISQVKLEQKKLEASKREEKREQERLAYIAAREARLQVERDSNLVEHGYSLTNAELQVKVEENRILDIQLSNFFMVNILATMPYSNFIESMKFELERRYIKDLSPRQQECLADIYAKTIGKKGSQAYKQALIDFARVTSF